MSHQGRPRALDGALAILLLALSGPAAGLWQHHRGVEPGPGAPPDAMMTDVVMTDAMLSAEASAARLSRAAYHPITTGLYSHSCDAPRSTFHPKPNFEDKLPFVTVVAATYEARHFLNGILNFSFFEQVYPLYKLRLLVLDDGGTTHSPYASYWNSTGRVDYHMLGTARMSIGEKRNWLTQHATGEVIVHFDDDDFYDRHYVRMMAEYLVQQEVLMVKIGSWWTMMPQYGYKDEVTDPNGLCVKCHSLPGLGFAWNWAYYRNVTQSCKYPNVTVAEEIAFVDCLQKSYGPGRIHEIGDVFSQAIKLDTCTGITSIRNSASKNVSMTDVIKDYTPGTVEKLRYFVFSRVDRNLCIQHWDTVRARHPGISL